MGHSNRTLVVLIILLGFLSCSLQGQNYRDQKKLIRLKPNSILVFGKILTPAGEPLSGATISLFDPKGAKTIETIPVDDLGEYLFTLEKGKVFGLIIEKEGFFPYYSQFKVPVDLEEEWENPLQLPDGLQNRYELFYSPRSTSPSNQEVLEKIINFLTEFNNLLVWIPEEADSVFPLRISRIKSSFVEAGIESHRLYIGSTPDSPDQFIILNLINEKTLNEIVLSDKEDDAPQELVSADKWTLQFVASKNELPTSSLKGISNFKVYQGKDGYYRYTYGIYNSKEEADSGKSFLNSKGFSQAFAKKIEDLQKL